MLKITGLSKSKILDLISAKMFYYGTRTADEHGKLDNKSAIKFEAYRELYMELIENSKTELER